MESEQVVIEADGLVKTYGKFQAVRGVSFQVRLAKFSGFLGQTARAKPQRWK